MFQKLKHLFAVINRNTHETAESKKNDIALKKIVSILLASVSLILSIINIITEKYLMMASTLLLMVAFTICALVLHFSKNRNIVQVIVSIVVVTVFSYYAVFGQNDGFAILWIVLIPAISTLFLSFRLGIVISSYFFLLLIVMFYTPVKDLLPAFTKVEGTPGYYDQFTIRFPVLYLASFVVSIFLNAQKIYYSKIAETNSLYDSLTNLKNRRYYTDYLQSIGLDKNIDKNMTILSIDINGLKSINDRFGHSCGDEAIIHTAEILRHVLGSQTDNIFRTGGDEYIAFFDDKENNVSKIIDKINSSAAKVHIKEYTLSLSIGYVKGREYIQKCLSELLVIVDQNMYKAKDDFYKTNQKIFKNH